MSSRPKAAVVLLVGALLLLSSLLGGRARLDTLQFLLLALATAVVVPLTLIAAYQQHKLTSRSVSMLALLALLPVLQLIPLPAQLAGASSLAVLAEQSRLLSGAGASWQPISVDTPETIGFFLFALLPIAVFIGTSVLGARDRYVLAALILAVGVVSALVGLLQIAQGAASRLHWYVEAGRGSEATGFFSNRNHFAALLYVSLLLAAGALVHTVGTVVSQGGWRAHKRSIMAIAGLVLIILLVLGAIVMSRSRAGLALTIVALVGVFALSLSDLRSRTGAGLVPKLLAGVLALAMLFSSQFAMYRMMQRFEADPLEDARLSIATTTWNAVLGALPFGTGMGTFVPAFKVYELPQVALLGLYANRAHNDYLEMALEGGVVAIALIIVFLIWFFVSAAGTWRRAQGLDPDLGTFLARAASIAVGLLLAHALVDYGLRTPAIAAVFAFCCALLVPAPTDPTQIRRERSVDETKRVQPRKPSTQVPASAPRIDPAAVRAAVERTVKRPVPTAPLDPKGTRVQPVAEPPSPPAAAGRATTPPSRWGEDVVWPSAWTNEGSSEPKSGPKVDNDIAQPFDWTKLGPKSPTKE